MFNRIQNRIGSMSKITRVMIAGAVVAGTLGAGSMAMAKGPHKMNQEKWESMSQEEKQEMMNKRLDKRMERMTQELELTDAQVPQVRAVFESSQAQRHEIMQKYKGDREAARTELKALKQSTRAQLEGVLTADQVQKLEQLKKDHKGKRHGKRGKHGKHGHKRFEKMSAELNLSAEQETQVKAIMKDARQEREEISSLVGSREEAKPELRELGIRTDARIKEVLSDEQDARFDELKAQRKERRGKRG